MKSKYLYAAGAFGMTLAALPSVAHAQDRFLGEIFTVGYTYCPQGSIEAQGQLLAISSNSALFSLLGTQYGGDGVSTFAIPDLRGRYVNSQGQGNGQPAYTQGQQGGSVSTTTTVAQMPLHDHDGRMRGTQTPGTAVNPNGAALGTTAAGNPIYSTGQLNAPMAQGTVQITPTGGGQAFSIQDPFLTLRQCVVTQGLFPSRP